MEPTIHAAHEPATGTWQFIVADPQTKDAAIIDPVLDYDKDTGVVSTTSADSLMETVKSGGYTIVRILETHAHADHLSASRYLQNILVQSTSNSPLVCIGKRIGDVQKHMSNAYGIPVAEMENAFDHVFQDDEVFKIGNLDAKAIHLPGHTPDHMGYVIGRNVFTGDSIFNPDVGSARCDFPGGSADQLYESMQKLLSFPADYKLYTGHDYPPATREAPGGPVPYTTVKEQGDKNKHVKIGTERAEFVQWRSERDSSLSLPRLMVPAMQVNLRGGRLPSTGLENFKLTQIPRNVVQV